MQKYAANQTIKLFKQKALKMELFENHFTTYEYYTNTIRYIDIIILLVDFIAIIVLYFDHFGYINNNYELSSTSNIIRSIFLVLSFVICTVYG
jgi:hypothetical protein